MKTNLDSIFKTDEHLEQDGVWFDISEKTGFLVRRFGGFNSPKIKAMMAKHYRPFSRQIEAGTMDATKEKEIMTRVFVEACIINWRGIEIDGVDTAFEKEVAVKLLCGLPDLADKLVTYATDSNNYKEDLGNS